MTGADMSHTGDNLQLSQLTLDELYARVAEEEYDFVAGASDEEKKRLGRLWFSQRLNAFKERICPELQDLLEKPEAELIVALGTLVLGLNGHVSPMTVVYLLLRRGLDNLCT